MSGAQRPVVFDITHIVTRLERVALTGIDQVDFAFARHFARSDRLDCGAHYGWSKPHRFSPDRVRATLSRLDGKRAKAQPSLQWPALRRWIIDGAQTPVAQPVTPGIDWSDFAHKWALRTTMDGAFKPPQGAIYLNVAQHAFEFPRYFRWLEGRPDLKTVFLVHDLLPLDAPEFFRAGYEARFQRRFATIFRHARAIVTTSGAVRDRIAAEYRKRGREPVPVHVQPLASALAGDAAVPADPALRKRPYFVVVSTIEPRKNHLLLLHVWRALAARCAEPPKLVVVGVPGWNCDQTLAMLDRCRALRDNVRQVSGLPDTHLRHLIAHARALLMPSFAEGYGLPVVEALTLGTRVIASDIPVFREVSQGHGTFLSPLNGDAWSDAILAHAGDDDEGRRVGRPGTSFKAPSWEGYFAGIESFLDRL